MCLYFSMWAFSRGLTCEFTWSCGMNTWVLYGVFPSMPTARTWTGGNEKSW